LDSVRSWLLFIENWPKVAHFWIQTDPQLKMSEGVLFYVQVVKVLIKRRVWDGNLGIGQQVV